MRELSTLLRVMWRMSLRRPDLRRYFWHTFVDIARHNPAALQAIVIQMVLYLHLGTFAGFVLRELDRQIGDELPRRPLPETDELCEPDSITAQPAFSFAISRS